MSVSLLEVLENAGYDIKNNLNDANWLLSQKDDFDDHNQFLPAAMRRKNQCKEV